MIGKIFKQIIIQQHTMLIYKYKILEIKYQKKMQEKDQHKIKTELYQNNLKCTVNNK